MLRDWIQNFCLYSIIIQTVDGRREPNEIYRDMQRRNHRTTYPEINVQEKKIKISNSCWKNKVNSDFFFFYIFSIREILYIFAVDLLDLLLNVFYTRTFFIFFLKINCCFFFFKWVSLYFIDCFKVPMKINYFYVYDAAGFARVRNIIIICIKQILIINILIKIKTFMQTIQY